MYKMGLQAVVNLDTIDGSYIILTSSLFRSFSKVLAFCPLKLSVEATT